MNILVTGSSGTIGTRLCETLLKQGKDVVGVDWVPNKWQPNVEAITTHLDLREDGALEKAKLPKDIDAIVHLAANARVYELVEDPSRARDNFLTLFNALEFARKRGIKRFLFASSREVYGNAGAEKYSEEMVKVDLCESPYTASKLGGEALVQAYARCYDMDAVIFRFSNVYGMYDDSVRVVPLFLRLARKNEPLTVFGKDKCLDFTYIDDTVAGVILTLEKFADVKNETFNLAYGQGVTILHLAETIKSLTASTSAITHAESRTGEVVRFTADIAKAKSRLGYSPKVSFEEGIQRSVEWYAAHS
ncbi:MAG: NAD-dependent epimerase/dehydratase family protein [Candidatus Peregrinibacteria bacterium]|nr:NAD-dependent epimerase/dehydratase family protein [Candidatus Peregrinibacteria bacterium]